MRITQAYVPSKLHASGFYDKFNLQQYKNINAPACFFGAHVSALPVIKAHRGHVTLIWIGMDGYHLSQGKHDVSFIRGCRNIATSESLQMVLDDNGVENEYWPITCFDFKDIKPQPLGKKVYFYYGNPDLYQLKMMQEIDRSTDFEVIYVKGWGDHSRQETMDLYGQCFAGVRLRQIDGLSNTGIEMGLMGRMVIHNGDAPNNIPFVDKNDVIIKLLSLRDAQLDPHMVSKRVRKFIDIGDDWLNI